MAAFSLCERKIMPGRQSDAMRSTDSKIVDHGSFASLQVTERSEDAESIGAFLQHSGCGISSRQAENHLFEIGESDKRETLAHNEDPAQLVRKVIAKAHGPEVSGNDVLLGSSGANAFYSLFQTACEITRAKGKDLWIRLGWLYLDTIEAMNLLTEDKELVIALEHLDDFGRLDGIFEKHGDRIAGIVTEFPTNPLLHSCNLERSKSSAQIESSPRYRSDHGLPQECKDLATRRRRGE